MTNQAPRRHRFALLAGLVIFIMALGTAAYGIWSRQSSVSQLKGIAQDASLPRVNIISPTKGPNEQSLTLPGEVRAWNEAQIYGQASGYVSHWYKDYGAKVNAGDLLATIEAPSLDAEYAASKSNLAVAQANYNLAVVTAGRFNAISASAAVTQQEVDEKNAAAAAQKAQVAAALQNVDHYQAMVAFKKIVSPFSGIVTARRVNVGDFINSAGADTTSRSSGEPPFSVGEIDKLRIFVSVPQSFGSILKPDLKAVLHLINDPSKTIPVKFLTMAGSVNRATRTIITEFVLEDPKGDLWPGAYVEVEIIFPSDPNIMIVPSQALLFRSQGMQVAMVDDHDHVHLQDVTLGRNLGLEIQVVNGLKLSDKIIANPSLDLLEGQQVKAVKASPGYEPIAVKPQ